MSFSKKTLTSVLWALSSGYAGIVISFIGNLALARILLPAEFGVFTLALSLLTILAMLTGFGSQEAILQCRDETIQDLIPTAFWMGFIIATFVAIIGIFVGLLLRDLYGSAFSLLFIVLSLTVPVNSLANSHASVIMRDMTYKPVALIRMLSTLLSFALSILAAWAGFGVWALVVRHFSEALIYWLWIAQASKYQLQLLFNFRAARWIWDFGWRKMLSQMSEIFVSRYDNLVLGFFVGETHLGHYTQAFRLAGLGQQFTEGAISPILLPMFSTIQGSSTKLLYGFERVSYWLLKIVPLFGILTYLLGADAVTLVYGNNWIEAGSYFRLMFILIMFVPFASALKNFLVGAGKINVVVQINLVQVLFYITGVSIGGLLGDVVFVIWIVNLNQVLGTVLMAFSVSRMIPIGWPRIVFGPGAAFLGILIVAHVINLTASNFIELIGIGLGTTITYFILVFAYDLESLRRELRILWGARKV